MAVAASSGWALGLLRAQYGAPELLGELTLWFLPAVTATSAKARCRHAADTALPAESASCVGTTTADCWAAAWASATTGRSCACCFMPPASCSTSPCCWDLHYRPCCEPTRPSTWLPSSCFPGSCCSQVGSLGGLCTEAGALVLGWGVQPILVGDGLSGLGDPAPVSVMARKGSLVFTRGGSTETGALRQVQWSGQGIGRFRELLRKERDSWESLHGGMWKRILGAFLNERSSRNKGLEGGQGIVRIKARLVGRPGGRGPENWCEEMALI